MKRAASVAHLPAASPKVNRGGARRVVGANASTAPVLVASEKRCRASSRTARRAVAAVRCASLPSFISSTCVWSRPSMMLALRRTRVPGTRPRSVRSFPPSPTVARDLSPLPSPSSSSALAPQGTQGGGLEFMSFGSSNSSYPNYSAYGGGGASSGASSGGGGSGSWGGGGGGWGGGGGGAGFGGGGGGMGFGDTGATVEDETPFWRSSASIPRRSFGERWRCSIP